MMLTAEDHKLFSNAIQTGDLLQVKSMILQHPALINHPDWTPPPIHCAVLWNQPGVLEILLSNGADIEILDRDRQTTPLRYAVMFGRIGLIPLLLSNGANSESTVEGGSTALQLAIDAANGAFEDFDDLPSRETYSEVVNALLHEGLTE